MPNPKDRRERKGGYQVKHVVDVSSELQADILRRRKEDRKQLHADNRMMGLRMHRAQLEYIPMDADDDDL